MKYRSRRETESEEGEVRKDREYVKIDPKPGDLSMSRMKRE